MHALVRQQYQTAQRTYDAVNQACTIFPKLETLSLKH
jgi:hypothetical protein